ncbi:fluoride efflux transporter CrcB [Providencia sneebia]|uniref:Fluoride-specific ion channel FluC n=1 Tax=Providencia sneebia DSM 19967 TaxID=1141660 RepID=K8WB53_9GAMM|nr:fluoride efflux transporter CrcB [Providencia sneebia]EKT53440.1 camphor resistance protein CrcB [Providencia sneebia DSM 19967]
MFITNLLLAGLGGGVGSLLRWGIGNFIGEKYHGKFPLGTFVINISGAFIIGFLSRYFFIDFNSEENALLAPAILTGILGGYTTFSTMQLEALKLTQKKEQFLSFFYLLISVIVGLVAAFLGVLLAN